MSTDIQQPQSRASQDNRIRSTRHQLMSTRNRIQIRLGIMLIAAGMVFLTAYMVHSPDAPIRYDTTGAFQSKRSGEVPRNDSRRVDVPPTVPPALQKGLLR